MPRKTIQVKGMMPDRILFKMSKEGFNAIKDPIKEAGAAVQKRAKEIAPVKSGLYRKSIRRKLRTLKREGQISTTVGIKTNGLAIAYAGKVEAKHHIFTRLEHEFRNPVTAAVKSGIVKGLRSVRFGR
jgi:hypothetical protein